VYFIPSKTENRMEGFTYPLLVSISESYVEILGEGMNYQWKVFKQVVLRILDSRPTSKILISPAYKIPASTSESLCKGKTTCSRFVNPYV
jgi:hypothetical protein